MTLVLNVREPFTVPLRRLGSQELGGAKKTPRRSGGAGMKDTLLRPAIAGLRKGYQLLNVLAGANNNLWRIKKGPTRTLHQDAIPFGKNIRGSQIFRRKHVWARALVHEKSISHSSHPLELASAANTALCCLSSRYDESLLQMLFVISVR